MAIYYNADEIFQMAQQIEANGALFYLRAAKFVKDEKVKKILEEFAAWEIEHEKKFTKMHEEFLKSDNAIFAHEDPDDIAGSYLRAIAGGHVFKIDAKPEDLLTGNETYEQIIQLAIEGEKNSIIFYLGLQETMPPEFGEKELGQIIKEEMQHITMLSNLLESVK